MRLAPEISPEKLESALCFWAQIGFLLSRIFFHYICALESFLVTFPQKDHPRRGLGINLCSWWENVNIIQRRSSLAGFGARDEGSKYAIRDTHQFCALQTITVLVQRNLCVRTTSSIMDEALYIIQKYKRLDPPTLTCFFHWRSLTVDSILPEKSKPLMKHFQNLQQFQQLTSPGLAWGSAATLGQQ